MKTVKAWEALKAFQEEGRLCRPVDANNIMDLEKPMFWNNFFAREYFIEPPKPQVVEFTAEGIGREYYDNIATAYPSILFVGVKYDKLHGKRWRCVCTEIMEDE